MEKIGLFWGSNTGNQEDAVKFLQEYLESEGYTLELFNIADTDPAKMLEYDKLIIGCPTWHIGELQDDWDFIYNKYKELDFTGITAAFFGCGIGSLLGMGLAWFIGIGFSSVFANAGTDVFTFHVDSSSLASGWFWGFHLSILTLFFSALWSSRLIIVHALKSVPQRIPKHVPWGIYIFLLHHILFILLQQRQLMMNRYLEMELLYYYNR